MAELRREQVLDALENSWGTYVERYYALSPAAQSVFLAKQGYARLADLLAHVIAWWEEGALAVERLLHDPAYRSPDHDVNAFNAQAAARWRDLDETAVQQRFEQARLALLDLIAGLPDNAFRDRQIADRLHIEVIVHMGEHEIQPQSVQGSVRKEITMTFSLAKMIEDRQADQYDLHMKYISPHMARVQQIIGFDKIYTRGEGAYLWDADGNRYLDLLAGYSVFNLGRDHPVVKQAMLEYLMLQRPTLVKMDCPLLAGLLAEELVKRMPPGLDAIFFANSGADAVDTAIKFARYATRRPRVLYLDHSFHGLTLGTLSINGGEAFKKGFEPLIPATTMVAMNDLEALERELRKGDVAAFVVEPIQGKGVYIPQDNYLPEAQRLCRKYGAQFVCDEIQVGLGRAGRFLSCEHWNLEPDMVTIAKSLGGGYVPVSAVIMRREINNKVFGNLKRAQVHSTTFGQNDMGMAAGLATLHVMDEEKIVERSATLGARLLARLAALKDKHEMIADVRGKGLVIGIEFRPPSNLALRAAWTAIEAAEKGLFTQLVVMSLMRDHRMMTQVGGPGVNIVKLLPPLIIGDEEVEMIVNAFDAIMGETKNLNGRVWATSGEPIKQAMSA